MGLRLLLGGLVATQLSCALLWGEPQRAAIEAIRDDDHAALVEALDSGIDPAAADQHERTLLHYAAVYGRERAVALLLERGVATDPVDAAGRHPLHYAVEGGHERATLRLLGVAQRIDVADEQGRTPLMIAALRGESRLLEALLAAGADPDRRDAAGATALSLAAAARHRVAAARLREVSRQAAAAPAVADVVRARDIETLRWMLAHGLNPEATWMEQGRRVNLADIAVAESAQIAALLQRYGVRPLTAGSAALAAAVLSGDEAAVEALLARAVDADAAVPGGEVGGRTVLHEAARLGRVAIIEQLLEHGADPARPDAYGADALWHAAVGYVASGDAVAGLERAASRSETVLALLAAGATPGGGDHYGFAPLHAAAAWGDGESVAALLNAGAPLEQQDRNGRTALTFAALFGNHETVEELLSRGADPSPVDHWGGTPITYARLAAAMAGDAAARTALREAGGGKAPGPRRGTPPLAIGLDERRLMQLDRAVAIYDSAREEDEQRGRLLPYTTTCSGYSCIYPPIVVLPRGTVVELLYREAGDDGRLYSVYLVQEAGLRGLLFEDSFFGEWPPAGAASSEVTIGRIAHIRSMRWVEAFDIDLRAVSGGLIW